MNEIEKLLNVLKSQKELCHEKIEIVKGTCNTYIKIKPIIEALEKQIPKKPISQETDEKTHHKCECGSIHLTVYKRDGLHMGHKAKFCEWCGQAIDWSGEE